MKKLTFLFAMLLFMVTSMFAETQKTTITINGTTPTIETSSDNVAAQTATNQVYDSTKLTVSKVYNDMKAGIVGMAKALKAPVEHVYVIMCKQQVVKSITDLIILILVWIGTILLFSLPFIIVKKMNKDYKLENPEYKGNRYDLDDLEEPVLGICFGAGVVFGIIAIVYTICSLGGIVTGFINPEYGAIKDVIGFFK